MQIVLKTHKKYFTKKKLYLFTSYKFKKQNIDFITTSSIDPMFLLFLFRISLNIFNKFFVINLKTQTKKIGFDFLKSSK